MEADSRSTVAITKSKSLKEVGLLEAEQQAYKERVYKDSDAM